MAKIICLRKAYDIIMVGHFVGKTPVYYDYDAAGFSV